MQEASTAVGVSPQKGGCVGVTTLGGATYESTARPFTGELFPGYMYVSQDRQPDATTYLEFFNDTVCGPSNVLNGSRYASEICRDAMLQNHTETMQGGLAVWPPTGNQELASTAMDPTNKFDSGGVRWFEMATGDAKYGKVLTELSNQTITTDTSFKKSSSMGDLEMLCNAAPIQIGNRVWIDSNRNGIQDPGEPPVAGATVRLYRGSNLRGTAITDAQGRYYFTSTLTSEATSGNGDNVGGNMLVNAPFTIKLDNPADYAIGGPLVGYSLTTADQMSMSTSLDDSVDSDAFRVSWMPEISVEAHLAGFNDHTFDVGFVTTTAPVTVGNHVWYDENSDGLQTAGEAPAAGVTLTLTDLSGGPVVDVSGHTVGPTTTDASGRYQFGNLHPGSYKVNITYPTGMQATTAGVGSDRANDSSTTSATSSMIPAGGEDTSLDFGLVPTNGWPAYNATTTTSSTTSTSSSIANGGSSSDSTLTGGSAESTSSVPSSTRATDPPATSVSGGTSGEVSSATTTTVAPAVIVDGGVAVGNYVWFDVDKDGIQDAGEWGISGVQLVVRDMAGRPVTDRRGGIVGPTYTDASGHYYFSNLPVGQYQVFITYPFGFSATKSGSGTTGNDSSTDSAVSKALPSPGMKDFTLDFGLVVSAVIQEKVWIDTDRDGLPDPGEEMVPDADVMLQNEDGTPARNVRGEQVGPTQTRSDGSFTFRDLVPGRYRVTVVYPEGKSSAVTGGTSEAFITSAVVPPSAAVQAKEILSSSAVGETARRVSAVVSIGNVVWLDNDKNGFQGIGERGVAGATLTVFKADGQTRARDEKGRPVPSQRTGANGRYLFSNLPPGAYVVKIVYPAGFQATVAKKAGRARNSSTREAKSLRLSIGQADMTLDFGVIRAPLTRLPATL